MTFKKWIRWKLNGSPRCRVCNKPLHNPFHIAAGVGGGCQRKLMSLKKKVDEVRRNNVQNP